MLVTQHGKELVTNLCFHMPLLWMPEKDFMMQMDWWDITFFFFLLQDLIFFYDLFIKTKYFVV